MKLALVVWFCLMGPYQHGQRRVVEGALGLDLRLDPAFAARRFQETWNASKHPNRFTRSQRWFGKNIIKKATGWARKAKS